MKIVIPQEVIEQKIFIIRGQKVMLDRDLADLYGVPVKRLNEQVKRNKLRFPKDFMFQLDFEEAVFLRSQFATLKKGRGQHAKYLPNAFTEHGILMLSSVLNSRRAIEVNITIMRIFVRLRELILTHKDLALKLERLEHAVEKHEAHIHAIFEIIQKLTAAEEPPKRRIGFHG